ncbi:MAG: lysylphosphatidylglycerol synthase transmembrane domain-containing protein [Rhodospirillales bacterium]
MWKKWLALALKILVSGALIWFLVGKVDLAAAKERILKVAPEMLALATVLIAVQIVIANFRWRVVMDALLDTVMPFRRTQRIIYIGFFFNQALPSSVGGDAVRMVLGRRAGMPLGQAVSSVFLDRLANLLALVLIVVTATPFFVSDLPAGKQPWAWSGLTVLLIGAVAGLTFLIALERLPESLRHWRVVRGLIGLAGDTRRVFLVTRNAFRAMSWSVIGFVNVALVVYALAAGLKLNISLMECLVLIPPVLLISTLPISIAGWGVREGAMVAALGLVGVPPEGALVLSILLGLLALAVCLPGGLVWMVSSEKRGDVLAEASRLEAETPDGADSAR